LADETIRTFIAIELPDEVRQKLSQLQTGLKSGGQPAVRWVNPNSIHLTLQFLGNVAVNRVAEITRAIEEATNGISPFSIEVKGTGVFPNARRTRVAWVGLSGDMEKLLLLQKRIESNLEKLGFVPEARDFTPHLTLARVNEQATPQEREKFGELVTGTKFEAGIINVGGVSLMRSQLSRGGAVYTRLSFVKLG
jgi:RNA 2',3'-cyclic 3'-phosphodiesterase